MNKKGFSRIIRTSLGISVILALATVGIALADIISVDTFTDGFQSMQVDQSNPSDTDYTSGSMIGGERDAQLIWSSGTGGAVNLYIDSGDSNFLSFAQASGYRSTATLQWDGSDSSMTLNTTGLSNTDLTDSGANDSFRIRIIDNDNPVGITMRVYTDASNWSTRTQNTRGDIDTGQIVDMIFPFSSFTTGGGTGADFADVGAIEMMLDGVTVSLAGADVSFNLFEATPNREYGDLPSSYGSSITDAYHVPLGIRLGENVDTESAPQSNAYANGDDLDGASDEDGVTRNTATYWTNNASVDLFVEANGCASNCRLNGWIDWNGDSDFVDTGEQIFNEITINNGSDITRTITVPDSSVYTVGDNVYARFRICQSTGQCNSPTITNVTNGEVEDYRWDFGPTALNIENLSVRIQSSTNWPLLFGISIILLIVTIYVLVKSRQVAR